MPYRSLRPVSTGANRSGRGCVVVFFALFGLIGLAASIPAFFLPIYHLVAARSWAPVSCDIHESRVREHSGGRSSTYSIEVRYTYLVDDRRYESTRYDFFTGSTSGSAAKQAIVDRIPPGARTTCWVDPADPTQAVLSRDWSPTFLLGLLPFVFVLIGVGGLVFTLRAGSGAPARTAWLPTPQTPVEYEWQPLTLKPRHTRVGQLVGILFMAAFWNGITGVFVWQVVLSFRRGSPEWGLAIFLSIFVLIGLGLLLAIPYQFLALWNPRPHLTLTPGTLRLGKTAELEWKWTGLPGRIRQLSITLEGREEATYSSGKSTSTARSVFHTFPLVDTAEPLAIADGRVRIAIPEGTMHSFAASHNRVVWTLKVAGGIRAWPDVAEELEIAVLPARPGGFA
jgi:Protein of unknown function (DUF3592)